MDYAEDEDEIVLVRDWKKLVLAHKQLLSPGDSPVASRPPSRHAASRGGGRSGRGKAVVSPLRRDAASTDAAASKSSAQSMRERKRARSATSQTPEKDP